MTEDFSADLIREYRYWDIFIARNQGYLGRCVVWCKRENALDLTEATPEEQYELVMILRDLKEAVISVFQADWFNYTFLGNVTRHLHCHFIPRYAAPALYKGIAFKDALYGNNYKTDHDFRIPEDVLRSIQRELKTALQSA